MNADPFDHNAECRFCDEQGTHAANCPWAWREAIIDACVVDWIFTKAHETDPRKAVNDLLVWQQKIALDPAVSKEAHDLHERIKALEADAERERDARRMVDEALRQAVEQRRQQLLLLKEIRVLADDATGTDRSRGDAREPGALGAVKLLIAEIAQLRSALAAVERALRDEQEHPR